MAGGLIAYSSLLGPIGGILISDYFFLRSKILHVDELYTDKGRYWYSNGYNLIALFAMCLGILPNIPGFLTTIGVLQKGSVPEVINGMYHYAWFVGFFVSGVSYFFLTRFFSKKI